VRTDSLSKLFGDPEGLAKTQFRLAQELCAECRDYHATWPYRRLSRMIFGIEASVDIVGPLLRRVTPPNGRILVAGAADAGMLALTAQATKTRTPSIDVADHCPTPLAICRRFARTQKLSMRTRHLEFGSPALIARYDVIFGDCILQFLPRRFRVAFLKNLRQAMTENGALVVVERLRTGSEDRSRRRDYAAETLDALARRDIELPEDALAFRRRLERVVSARRARISLASENLPSVLAEAGFHVAPLSAHEGQRTAILPNGERVTMEIAVASPRRTGSMRESTDAPARSRRHQAAS
jgi:hypothetical protein